MDFAYIIKFNEYFLDFCFGEVPLLLQNAMVLYMTILSRWKLDTSFFRNNENLFSNQIAKWVS